MLRRRPFLLLFVLMAGCALMQSAFAPARATPSADGGNLPPGTVCTTCGPISMGVCAVERPSFEASELSKLPAIGAASR